MLRGLVVALLLGNLAFFAWSQGWLDALTGTHALAEREPERLARQVHPEAVILLPPGSAASAAAAAQAAASAAGAAVCLEAGPFGADQIGAAAAALRAELGDSAADAVTAVRADLPGRWMVYMGAYPDRDTLQRKADEIKRRGLPFEEIHAPASLDMGLSLGRFDDRADADRALASFSAAGIHSARVVVLKAPVVQSWLRAAQADEALARRLSAVRVAALGSGFAGCAEAPPAR